jgi:hypothetical protein
MVETQQGGQTMPIPHQDHHDWGQDPAAHHAFEDEVSKIPLMGGFLRGGLRTYDAVAGGVRCAKCGRLADDAVHTPAEPDEEPRHWG